VWCRGQREKNTGKGFCTEKTTTGEEVTWRRGGWGGKKKKGNIVGGLFGMGGSLPTWENHPGRRKASKKKKWKKEINTPQTGEEREGFKTRGPVLDRKQVTKTKPNTTKSACSPAERGRGNLKEP